MEGTMQLTIERLATEAARAGRSRFGLLSKHGTVLVVVTVVGFGDRPQVWVELHLVRWAPAMDEVEYSASHRDKLGDTPGLLLLHSPIHRLRTVVHLPRKLATREHV